jgi:hypothetical protein
MSACTRSQICSHPLRLHQGHVVRPSDSRQVRCDHQPPAQRTGALYFLHCFYAPLTVSFVDEIWEDPRESEVRSTDEVFCIWVV